MADDSIYRGLSPVGNLMTSTPMGRYHHLIRRINDLISSVGREQIIDMIHLAAISSIASSVGGSVTEVE